MLELNVTNLAKEMEAAGYICDEDTVLTVFLALQLQKPLLIEGAPGVGKTEMGKVLASILGTKLIRLQCYEGLDENRALYEWNYQKQLLKIQMSKELAGGDLQETELFSEEYLLERPLLQAIRAPERVVLLIDEVDKCDHEFEAFLFEVLSDFQVSIPEMGTMDAACRPVVVLTSNSERELSDGLRRRCIFMYLDYPAVEREVQIIKRKVPAASEQLANEVAKAVSLIRANDHIHKKPSISETLDWVHALVAMHRDSLSPGFVNDSLGLLLKSTRDQKVFQDEIGAEKLLSSSRV